MSPDPFFQSNAFAAQQLFAQCRRHCRCRGQNGFCGACIHPECLRLGVDGSVRVGLSAVPEDWFAALTALGSVLQLTRNNVAVLGQIATVPVLQDWRNPVLPRDASGGFAPNLAEHVRFWAVRENSPLGPAYGFEVCDVSGHAFQRIVLTAPANRELFERFVTDHQSPPEEANNWFPPNHSASAQRRRIHAERISFLRTRSESGANYVRRLPVNFLLRMLGAAAAVGLPLRTTHYTPALSRSVLWMPQCVETSAADETVLFAHGDQAGLHLFLPGVSEVWLWQGGCSCCDQEQWTLEIFDASERIALAITVGDAQRESVWREIFLSLAQFN
ncbi:MAG: hypothetical protein QM813_22175 [Verrucomicrobiota bacterium]